MSDRKLVRFVLSAFLAMLGLQANEALAFPTQPNHLVGRLNTSGGAGGVGCHNNCDGSITVTISGEDALHAGQTATYTVTAMRGAAGSGTRMGAIIAASDAGTPVGVGASMPQVVISG